MAGRMGQGSAVTVEVVLVLPVSEASRHDVDGRLDAAAAELAGSMGLEPVKLTYFEMRPELGGVYIQYRAAYVTERKP